MPYKNREKKNEAQQRYRDRHPDVVAIERARLEKWKQDNPYVAVSRYCACGTAIHRKGKDACLSCEKKAAKKLPVRCRKCGRVFTGDGRSRYCNNCKKHILPSLLEAMRSYAQRRRAKREGVVSDFTQRDWREVKRFFGNRCAYCGQGGDLEQDHFIPLVKGGAYTKGNIVPACKACNVRKNDVMPWEWLAHDRYQSIANYLGAL